MDAPTGILSAETPATAATKLVHGDFVAPYKLPVKRIKTHEDLATFQKSESMKTYLTFLEKCSAAATDKKVSETFPASPVRKFTLWQLLGEMDKHMIVVKCGY